MLDPTLAQDNGWRREGQRLDRIGRGVENHATGVAEHVLEVGS
jgi:hypothetical protein